MLNTKKIRCLVIDDEPPAREILKKHIVGIEKLELMAEFGNAVEALSFLEHHHVDLLFLDIQMPQLLGTSFVRTLKSPPKIIFTTAHRRFAIEGFELDALDYLLKPVSFERFLKAVSRILQNGGHPRATDDASKDQDARFLYFRSDRKMIKVFLNDILFIESLKDYVRISTPNKSVITKHTISSLHAILPEADFIRIHRSLIVSVSKIDAVHGDAVEINKIKLPIGRLFKHDVNRLLNLSAANAT